MWWMYFCREEHLQTSDLNRALVWGYGHFVIFAAGAAVGSGFAILVDIVAHKAHVGIVAGEYAVAIPVAIYMCGLWFVRDRFNLAGKVHFVLPAFAALILLVPPTPAGLESIAVLTATSVLARSYFGRPTPQ